MAHMNINERRSYVKSRMQIAEMTPGEIKYAAGLFGCSYAAICADMAMIISKGEYTLYPCRRTKDAVIERDNYTCQYCGKTNCTLFVDHVIPTIMGGAGYPYNLVAVCGSCNIIKGKNRKVWVPANIDILKQLNPKWFLKILSLVNT